jgi:hypothetical protein
MKKAKAQFLRETEYCDYSHYLIYKTAQDFKRRYKSKRELAVALFYWVKDSVRYSLGQWNVKASQTLLQKYGTCTNKANLLVALYRAVGIPAGFGIMKVNGQRYLGPACIPMLGSQMSQRSTHTYVAVYLGGRWIKVDPSDDRKLSDSISHFNHTADAVEWDGYSNAELNLNKEDVFSDDFPVDDIDYIMRKKPRNAKGIRLKIFNLALNFYRDKGKEIKEGQALEPLLKKYFLKNYPLYYMAFISAIFYMKLNGTIEKYINRLMKELNNRVRDLMFREIASGLIF